MKKGGRCAVVVSVSVSVLHTGYYVCLFCVANRLFPHATESINKRKKKWVHATSLFLGSISALHILRVREDIFD